VKPQPIEADQILTPAGAGREIKVSRPTVLALIDREGLPAHILSRGPKGRRLIRISRRELLEWFAGRRERKVLDWNLHRRGPRGAA